MKIYEYGASVEAKVIGRTFRVKKPTNFVCVFEEHKQKDTEEYFALMRQELTAKGIEIVKEIPELLLVVASNGDEYSLSHEKTVTDDGIKRKHSNILRFIYSLNFTKDAVYIDKDNQYVDLTGVGLKDIRNRKSRCISTFSAEVKVNPDIWAEVIYNYIIYGYSFPGEVHGFARSKDILKLPPLEDKKGLLGICLKERMGDTLHFIKEYSLLQQYLEDVCGMEVCVMFNKK